MKRLKGITGGLLLPLVLIHLAWATGGETNETKVTLFGQVCLLTGPVSVETLKTVHAVSPEQVFPAILYEGFRKGTSEQLKRSLDQLRQHKGVPSAFDAYRERQTRRLEAILAFVQALETANQSRKAAPVLAVMQKHGKKQKFLAFQDIAKKIESGKKWSDSEKQDWGMQLYEVFADAIETDPEEDFHRAARHLKIHYSCNFDVEDQKKANTDEGNADEEEEPSNETAEE